MVENLVIGSLMACGVDVVKIGLASTPTRRNGRDLRQGRRRNHPLASHNPRQWNALKLLNDRGEFLTAVRVGYP